MKRSLKILDICPHSVYPLNSGGAIYSFSKAYILVKRGHRVDFFKYGKISFKKCISHILDNFNIHTNSYFPAISKYLEFYMVAAFAHAQGLFNALLHFKLLGYGLGAGGNYGKIYKGIFYGAESGMGSLISQIGIFSLIYVLLFNSIVNKSLDCIRYSNFNLTRKFLARFSLVIVIQYFINFLFSESSLSVSSNMLFFSIILISLNLCKNKR